MTMSKSVIAACALVLLSSGTGFAAGADDDAVQCNFYALTAAQRAMQTDAAAHQIPGLLGPVAGAMSPVPLDGVYISDPAIRRKVMAQAVYARRTPNKSIELTVRLVNCTDYPMQVLGRVSFMDGHQMPTENTSAWQMVMVPPKSFGNYREVSLGNDAESYLIEFRSNR
jgi:hypothetical protein